jgi:CheY-like chemotaxis protein
MADERVVRQVLLNLLGNAVKFTDPGGRITFKAEAGALETGATAVAFTVEDTGIGIDEAELTRIFEPFHRITRTDRIVEGSGLGLAITQRLVAALGGKISVTSRKGSGSRFRVECAFAPAPVAQLVPQTASDVEGYAGERKRILIADDDPSNRKLCAQLLESVGFIVRAAADGREALENLGEFRPHLVATDLVMPRVDGMQLLRTLRAEPAFAEIPVVGMSASASQVTREEAMRAGCSAFLSKPLQLTAFLATVGNQLGVQWRYRDARAEPSVPTGASAAACAFTLPAPLSAELEHLAKQGDIMALTARVDAALGADNSAQSFCDNVRTLAARYDIRGIRQLLATLNPRA